MNGPTSFSSFILRLVNEVQVQRGDMATIVLKYPRIKAVIQLYSNRFILSFSQARRRHTKSYVPYRILTIRNCFSSSFSASPVGASPSWNQPVPVVAPALSPVIATIVASKGVPPVWVPVGQVFLSLLTAGKKWITTQEKVTYPAPLGGRVYHERTRSILSVPCCIPVATCHVAILIAEA